MLGAQVEGDLKKDSGHESGAPGCPGSAVIYLPYTRSTDGAEMVAVAPHQFVNRAVLSLLGRR